MEGYIVIYHYLYIYIFGATCSKAIAFVPEAIGPLIRAKDLQRSQRKAEDNISLREECAHVISHQDYMLMA